MAEITKKPIWDPVRTRSLVYFNLGKTNVDFRRVDDKVRVVVVTKIRKYIAV